MKKNVLFLIPMVLVTVLLFMLKTTGMTAHIAISVVGILALAIGTILTKKEWKIPVLEIIMRVCYAIALISGIVIMNVHGIVALSIVHKVSAVLFMVLIVVLLANKLFDNKKA